MLIAREKRKSNLAEYILYMWQVEDMLRAFGLNIGRIEQEVVSKFQVEEPVAKEILDWYDNLIEMMRKEKVEEKGHVQVLKNSVEELTELHFFLLHQAGDMRYRQIMTMAAGNLIDFRTKSGAGEEISDVELALNGLYGHLMLRLQRKELHPQTLTAMESFSKMLGYLAARYKQIEEEELDKKLKKEC